MGGGCGGGERGRGRVGWVVRRGMWVVGGGWASRWAVELQGMRGTWAGGAAAAPTPRPAVRPFQGKRERILDSPGSGEGRPGLVRAHQVQGELPGVARRGRRRRSALPAPPRTGFLPPPRPLSRQAHAAMLVDVIHLWADRAPVNYTAPGAYGVLDQYLGGIRAMVGPEGRGQGRMGAQESAGRPRRSRRPPAPPCSPPCRSRRYKISRPCSRPRRGGEATRAS